MIGGKHGIWCWRTLLLLEEELGEIYVEGCVVLDVLVVRVRLQVKCGK